MFVTERESTFTRVSTLVVLREKAGPKSNVVYEKLAAATVVYLSQRSEGLSEALQINGPGLSWKRASIML